MRVIRTRTRVSGSLLPNQWNATAGRHNTAGLTYTLLEDRTPRLISRQPRSLRDLLEIERG
jgi:hypothetical protein